MSFKRIVLVAGNHETTRAFYHAFPEIFLVLIEKSEGRGFFLKRRARRLGWRQVLGQVAFQALVVPLMRRLSAARLRQILRQYELDLSPIPEQKVERVSSFNQEDARRRLRELQPDLVLVHGTRILSADTLASCDCPWINLHAGITPRYRGTHGGYWALYHNDAEHCGVTLHLVDEGIDTGDYLAQALIPRSASDNFVTYPWLQLAEGLKLVRSALGEWPSSRRGEGPSQLFYHPTLSQYLRGLLRGVR